MADERTTLRDDEILTTAIGEARSRPETADIDEDDVDVDTDDVDPDADTDDPQ